MRKLQTQDVFKMARIIRTADMREQISGTIKKAKQAERRQIREKGKASADRLIENVGIEILMSVLDACGNPEVERQVYDLLGGVAEKKPEEIKTQSFDATVELIKEIAKENNMKNFFSAAGKLQLK